MPKKIKPPIQPSDAWLKYWLKDAKNPLKQPVKVDWANIGYYALMLLAIGIGLWAIGAGVWWAFNLAVRLFV